MVIKHDTSFFQYQTNLPSIIAYSSFFLNNLLQIVTQIDSQLLLKVDNIHWICDSRRKVLARSDINNYIPIFRLPVTLSIHFIILPQTAVMYHYHPSSITFTPSTPFFEKRKLCAFTNPARFILKKCDFQHNIFSNILNIQEPTQCVLLTCTIHEKFVCS
jgi:hypothetical protein